MLKRFVIVAMFLLRSTSAQQSTALSQAGLTIDEYKVYAAVIDSFQRAARSSHPMVADLTSSFKCGSSDNGMTVSGCNGLRDISETAEERMRIVKRDVTLLEGGTITDFLAKNSVSVSIEPKIPTSNRYGMYGGVDHGPTPTGWDHGDYIILSRVGFNSARSQALVNVSFMSGKNANDSGGKYLFFVMTNGRWLQQGSSAVWELIPSDAHAQPR